MASAVGLVTVSLSVADCRSAITTGLSSSTGIGSTGLDGVVVLTSSCCEMEREGSIEHSASGWSVPAGSPGSSDGNSGGVLLFGSRT